MLVQTDYTYLEACLYASGNLSYLLDVQEHPSFRSAAFCATCAFAQLVTAEGLHALSMQYKEDD